MSDRYTHKDAEAAFARLASACGRTWSDRGGKLWRGSWWTPEAVLSDYEPDGQARLWTRAGNENRAAVGVWMLDHNGIYGGYVIHEMYNDHGGVYEPFGGMRRSAGDFCAAVNFAMSALGLREGRVRA